MPEPLDFQFEVFDRVSGPAMDMEKHLIGFETAAKAATKATDATDKALRGVEGAAKKTTEGATKLEHGVRGAGEGMKAATESAGRFHVELGNVMHSFMGLRYETERGFTFNLAEGFDYAVDAARRVIDGIKEIGEQAIRSAAKTETFKMSLDMLLGKEEGGQAFAYTEKVRTPAGYAEGQLRELEQRLIGEGFKQKGLGGLENAVPASLDVAAMFGGDFSKAQETAMKFAMIKETGFAQRRMLSGLGVEVPRVYEHLGKLLGITPDEAQKKATEGKAGADMILKAIYQSIEEKTGGPLGTAAEKFGKTVEGMLNKLSKENVMEGIFGKLDTSPAFATLRDFLSNVTALFDPNSEFANNMADAAGRVFDHFFKGLDKDKIEKVLTEALDELPGKIDAAVGTAEKLGAALSKIVSAVEYIVDKWDYISGAASFLSPESTYKKIGNAVGATPDTSPEEGTFLDLLSEERLAVLLFGHGAPKANDFIWRDGQAIQIDPNDSVVGFKQGGSLGYDGGAGAIDVPRAGRFGGVTVGQLTIAPVVQGGGNVDTEELTERLKAIVPEMLATAFEQQATEAGMD